MIKVEKSFLEPLVESRTGKSYSKILIIATYKDVGESRKRDHMVSVLLDSVDPTSLLQSIGWARYEKGLCEDSDFSWWIKTLSNNGINLEEVLMNSLLEMEKVKIDTICDAPFCSILASGSFRFHSHPRTVWK